MSPLLHIQKLFVSLRQCNNVVSAALVNFKIEYSSFGIITIDRSHEVSRHLWSGFRHCRQAGFSTEVARLRIYLLKNISVKFFDSLSLMCLLCRPLTSNDCMVYQRLSTHFSRMGKLSNQTSLAFLNKILRKRKAQNPPNAGLKAVLYLT